MEGLTIFFIPTTIVNSFSKNIIYKFLSEQGFLILNTHFITIQNLEKISYKSRFLADLKVTDSGILIIGLDVEIIEPNSEQKLEFPNLDNARCLLVQNFSKYYKVPLKLTGKNLIYISQNSFEAEKIIDILLPQIKEKLRDRLARFQHLWSTPYAVIKRLSLGKQRRAKVELIEYQGRLAVKKTFRPGCDRFLGRELFVMSELSKNCLEIPTIIHHESSFLIYPFYQNILDLNSSLTTKIPLTIAKKVINTMRYFYNLGYALIDFNPYNLILDQELGLKIVDFEFLYIYKIKPLSFRECYDLAGIPANFEGDMPIRSLKSNGNQKIRNYDTVWQPYFGLELSTILEYCSYSRM